MAQLGAGSKERGGEKRRYRGKVSGNSMIHLFVESITSVCMFLRSELSESVRVTVKRETLKGAENLCMTCVLCVVCFFVYM